MLILRLINVINATDIYRDVACHVGIVASGNDESEILGSVAMLVKCLMKNTYWSNIGRYRRLALQRERFRFCLVLLKATHTGRAYPFLL